MTSPDTETPKPASRHPAHQPSPRQDEGLVDLIDDALADSFPASDPPAISNPVTHKAPKRPPAS